MGKTLTVAIQGKASSTITDMGIIAGLLREQTGYELRAIPEDDMLLRIEWLKQGKIDLLYETFYAPMHGEGKRPEEIERNRGPFQLQTVASAHSAAFGYMVRGDSPVRTIRDIVPGTRIAVFDPIGERLYALLAWLNLNKGPIPENPAEGAWRASIVRFSDWGASLRSIAEGTADVAMATPENPTVREMAARPPGIRFLDLPAQEDPEGFARFRQVFPAAMVAPATQHGVKEIWGVRSVFDVAGLWCPPEFEADVAYQLTRWFDEKYELYKDKGNKLATYTLQSLRQLADHAVAPIHAGTARYLEEKGLWTKADDARQEYNLKLMTWYCELWDAALARADAKGITVGSANAAWTRLWADCKKEAGIPGYRLMTDAEIQGGLVLLRRLGR